MRADAAPFIGCQLSRSHFTMSIPSRYTCTCRGLWSPTHVRKMKPPRRIFGTPRCYRVR